MTAEALALRVEDAIKRLDARLRESEQWRDAVAEWRECVRRFGAGSMSAAGALLGLVRLAWGSPHLAPAYSTVGRWCVERSGGFRVLTTRDLPVNGATEHEALTVAQESAP